MHRRRLTPFLLPLLALLVGCPAPHRLERTAVARGDRDGILHVGNGAEPPSLDPHILSDNPSYRIVTALYEPLITLNPRTLEPAPGQAESWQSSADGLTFTFRLRQGLRWSNGDPLTAHDFVYSLQRALSPALGCPYDEVFSSVVGALAYKSGETTDFSTVGVRAIDDLTLEYRLTYPNPFFLPSHLGFAWQPVHRATIEAHGAIDARGTNWDRPGRLVSNGPFTLTTWNPNQIVILKRNPHYWNAESIRLNEIHYYPMESAETENRAFDAGQLHAALSIPNQQVAVLRERADPSLHIDPATATYYIQVNVRKPPFNDPRVRHAFSLALERSALTEFVLRGGQEPAFSFIPPASGHTPSTYLREDLVEARRLLAEAGFPNGTGFPRVTYIYNTLETHRQIAEALQQMWKRNLNVEVALENLEWKSFLERRREGDFQIARSGWIGTLNNPSSFTDLLMTGNGNNHSHWSSPAFDERAHRARSTLDPAPRARLFQEAEAILLDDLPVIPLYFYQNIYRLQSSVQNWTPSPDQHPFWRFIELRSAWDS